jgi:hypothetical protein
MKNISILVLVTLGIFLLTTCGEETQENHTDTIETPKKTYLDSPINTYEERIEAQNIANTLQSPNSYLNSRVIERDEAKKSVNQGIKQIEEQEKAIEAFLK